jgi:hypothetical protein
MPTTDELIDRLVDIRGEKGPEVLAESVAGLVEVTDEPETLPALICALVEQLNYSRHGIRVGTSATFDRYRVDSEDPEDLRYDWRLIAGNGDVVATSGGQGYENGSEADRIGHKVVTGGYVVTDARTGDVLGR